MNKVDPDSIPSTACVPLRISRSDPERTEPKHGLVPKIKLFQ